MDGTVNIILSEIIQTRKTNALCSPSHVDTNFQFFVLYGLTWNNIWKPGKKKWDTGVDGLREGDNEIQIKFKWGWGLGNTGSRNVQARRRMGKCGGRPNQNEGCKKKLHGNH